MSTAIDFYYDFSSPYGYLASTQIEKLANEIGRTINWHPILMGPMLQLTGSPPPVELPLKGKYFVHDFVRSADLFGIAYNHPPEFPMATVAAARTAIFLRHKSNDLIAEFSKRIYAEFFANGKDIREMSVISAVVNDLGVSTDELAQALSNQAIKDELKQDVGQAIERGVFGSPFLFLDNEPFWGFDRFEHIRRWAKKHA